MDTVWIVKSESFFVRFSIFKKVRYDLPWRRIRAPYSLMATHRMNATIIRGVVLMIVGLPVTHAIEYLEPNVQRIVGVLPTSVCNELIRLGEQGQLVLTYYYIPMRPWMVYKFVQY